MKRSRATALLLIAAAAAQAPGPAPGGLPATRRAYPDCAEMCKHAKGLGASSCMTECRTYTDSSPDPEESLEEFVADKSYNEGGGEDMEEAYEAKHDAVPSCKPRFSGKPAFQDLDLDQDGVLTASEVIDFGAKMCVSDEMAMQLFSMADRDRNKVIDPKEWSSVGEDTDGEKAIDDAVDDKIDESKTVTDDEYNEVSMPAFEEFDKDGNGELNDDEVENLIMFEFHRRFPDATKEELASMAGEMVEDLAEVVSAMDHDGDGAISKAEFERPADSEDFGGELKEATEDDKNEKEPDDLHRVEHPTAAPPPEDYLPAGPAPGAASPAPALFFARLAGAQRRQRGFFSRARGIRLRRSSAGARDPPLLARSLAARAVHQQRVRRGHLGQHFRLALTRLARRVAQRD